jgi:tRNA (cmo5U34)-methyltransferase
MNDNKTSHNAEIYDSQIRSTIPYYDSIHRETINLVKSMVDDPQLWLDTGCGTGTLVEKASEQFPNTRFLLADPSQGMFDEARSKLSSHPKIDFLGNLTSEEIDFPQKLDVITAIQSHHYMDRDGRVKSVKNCYNLLKHHGIYVNFENTRPFTKEGVEFAKNYWRNFQLAHGKNSEDVEAHLARFDVEYFPLTVEEHRSLLEDTGFRIVELLWFSYMQAGFYCVK